MAPKKRKKSRKSDVNESSTANEATNESTEETMSATEQAEFRINFRMEPFDEKECSWSTYSRQLQNKFALHNVPEGKKVPLLLDSIGLKTFARLEDLCRPDLPNTKTFGELSESLSKYYDPEPNTYAERYKFHKRTQLDSEGIPEYCAELRKLTEFCKFPADWLQEALISQLIVGVKCEDLRIKLMEEAPKTFKDAITIASTYTNTKLAANVNRVKIDDSKTEQVFQIASGKSNNNNQVRQNKFGNFRNASKNSNSGVRKQNNQSNHNNNNDLGVQKKCYRCLGTNHDPKSCFHRESVCNKCGMIGHISPACRNQLDSNLKNKNNRKFKDSKNSSRQNRATNLNYIDTLQSDDDEVDMFQISSAVRDKIEMKVIVNDKEISMEFDPGAGSSIIPNSMYESLFSDCKLLPPDIVLRSYFRETRRPRGRIICSISFQNQTAENVTLYVADRDDVDPVIGRPWLRALKIIDDRNNVHLNLNQVKVTPLRNNLREILKKNSSLFEGKPGEAKNYCCSLQLKENEKPIYLKARTVPLNIKNELTATLLELEKDGIIERTTLSDWGTPIVPVIQKGKQIRICGDYKCTLNKKLKDDKYPIPRIEEITAKLNGGGYFCKLDIQRAYLHLKVDEESSRLQTITTHLGNFLVKRLFFGIKNAPSIFQRYIDQLLGHLEGVTVFFDDIKIQGSTPAETMQRLENVFAILSENGIKLNKEKCQFMSTSIQYLGLRIDREGIKKTPEKIQTIMNAKPPKDVHELRCLLGLINHYNRFIPNLATRIEVLNKRLHKDREFKWTRGCQKAMDDMKSEICSERVLIPFNQNYPIVLSTDASPVGLGAVLSHRLPNGSERPIAFLSRSLSATERNYSQIDKEALAIVWAVKRCFMYIYGTKFILVTDNKPLTQIFHPDKGLPTLTTTRMLHYALILAGFSFEVEYRTSEKNANADFCSRFPQQTPVSQPEMDVHQFHHLETLEMLPVDYRTIKEETYKDPELLNIINEIRAGSHNDLTLNLMNDIIMRGDRTYIPKSLRNSILGELHLGHLGSSKMKNLARSVVYWPNIDKDIENVTKECEACKKKLPAPSKEWHPWEQASAPWCRIHLDFATYKNKLYLLIVDSYSKWLEVYPINSTSATNTIDILREVFARFGMPKMVISDNGPPFPSDELTNFLRKNGINTRFSAAYHPNSNGQVERYVRTFKEAMDAEPQTPIRTRIARFLLSYRRAPHSYTGYSPAELMYNRQIRTRLDLLRFDLKDEMANTSHRANRSFSPDEKVQVRLNDSKQWTDGTVMKRFGKVLYLIRLADGIVVKRHVDQMRAI